MAVLNWDRVWKRVAQLPDFRGRKQSQFRFIAIGKQFSLTTGQTSGTTPVDFAAGAIVLGITAGLSVASQAGTQLIRDLSGARISIDYPASDGSVITGGRMNAAALFGRYGEHQFPAKEIIIPGNGSLNVVVENLTTSTIAFDLVFHSMIYRAAAG